MDISQFQGRKNSKNAGRAQDKALRIKLMFCIVILVYLVNVTFSHF
ncbi:unnamed protein product [Staurois parvus]|uniref:Uncharacterized protein n=1 Tax=Staurois parvus TaxID=386267 RepID=A0ABN9E151_9NEOB|nr:unnamed protein product [Staurois parvus]